MTITYEYGSNLYVNTTNRCTCSCDFCLRNSGDGVGTANSLWLEREPTREEILGDILKRDLKAYGELVFCGYGEPAFRLEDILWVCGKVRETSDIKTRMDTNGHASLINGKDTPPMLKGLVDTLSISLNYPTAEEYVRRCRPRDGEAAYRAMLDFTREAAKYVPNVVMTVVDIGISQEDIEKCRMIAEGLGARFRIRKYV